jgi:hypothetical protein
MAICVRVASAWLVAEKCSIFPLPLRCRSPTIVSSRDGVPGVRNGIRPQSTCERRYVGRGVVGGDWHV